MVKNIKAILIWSIVILAVIFGSILLVKANNAPGKYDQFATCIKEKGAQFYGAFWCPHCRAQKNMFGKSAKLLPYTECSTPDGNSQLAVCDEKEIESYPTWIFADESRVTGELSLEKLAEKTSCQLP